MTPQETLPSLRMTRQNPVIINYCYFENDPQQNGHPPPPPPPQQVIINQPPISWHVAHNSPHCLTRAWEPNYQLSTDFTGCRFLLKTLSYWTGMGSLQCQGSYGCGRDGEGLQCTLQKHHYHYHITSHSSKVGIAYWRWFWANRFQSSYPLFHFLSCVSTEIDTLESCNNLEETKHSNI